LLQVYRNDYPAPYALGNDEISVAKKQPGRYAIDADDDHIDVAAPGFDEGS
jgi:hypothetical protein